MSRHQGRQRSHATPSRADFLGFDYVRRRAVKMLLPEKFESLEQCEKWARIHRGWLKARGSKEAAELANKLCWGWSVQPCGLGACRYCRRDWRKLMISKVHGIVRNPRQWKAVTIVWYDQMFHTEELAEWTPKRLANNLRKRLGDRNISGPVIGSFELDYDVQLGLWVPHVHLLVRGSRRRINRLRSWAKRPTNMIRLNGKTPRPMVVQRIKNPNGQFSYPWKGYWARIEHYEKDGKQRRRKYRLKKEEGAAALLKLHELGFGGCLFLVGYTPDDFGLKRKRRSASSITTARNAQRAP